MPNTEPLPNLPASVPMGAWREVLCGLLGLPNLQGIFRVEADLESITIHRYRRSEGIPVVGREVVTIPFGHAPAGLDLDPMHYSTVGCHLASQCAAWPECDKGDAQ